MLADRTVWIEGTDHQRRRARLCGRGLGNGTQPELQWATFWGDLLDPTEVQRFLIYDNHMGTSSNA
jgi:hypothetical protein